MKWLSAFSAQLLYALSRAVFNEDTDPGAAVAAANRILEDYELTEVA